MRNRLIGPTAASFLALLLLVHQVGDALAQGAVELRLVTADVALLREAPSPTGAAVGRLPVGTRVRVLSRSSHEQEIGGARAHWYHVADEEGEALGWVFGALTVPLDPARPEVAYGALVEKFEEENRSGAVPFRTAITLERALEDAQRLYGASPEMELLEIAAIDLAAQWLLGWPPRNPAHRAWYEEHQDMIRHTPIGWRVSEEALWELADRYRGTSAADRIAFRAAWTRSDHCEDDANCWLLLGLEPASRYLERFPSGQHVEESLRRLRARTEIAAEYACWDEETGRPRVDSEAVARARALVQPLRSPYRDSVLMDLERIEEKCAGGSGGR